MLPELIEYALKSIIGIDLEIAKVSTVLLFVIFGIWVLNEVVENLRNPQIKIDNSKLTLQQLLDLGYKVSPGVEVKHLYGKDGKVSGFTIVHTLLSPPELMFIECEFDTNKK